MSLRATIPAVALALLACGEEPAWSSSDAVKPLLSRLDENGDGLVQPIELEPHAYAAFEFGALDTDGSGALSDKELLGTLVLQDPTRFDRKGRRAAAMDLDPGMEPLPASGASMVEELLRFLGEAALAADPDVVLPEPELVQAALATGDLGSEEGQRCLCQLALSWNQAGLTFPPALHPSSRVTETAGGECPPDDR